MKGVHSQPLLLFLCWFMAWGGLKRLLIFILLRQTAFGIKDRGSKGKGGRTAEVQKTRLEVEVRSQLWATKENAPLKLNSVTHWSLARSKSAGVFMQSCVPVNMHGDVCVSVARTYPHTCRCACRGRGRQGAL